MLEISVGAHIIYYWCTQESYANNYACIICTCMPANAFTCIQDAPHLLEVQDQKYKLSMQQVTICMQQQRTTAHIHAACVDQCVYVYAITISDTLL